MPRLVLVRHGEAAAAWDDAADPGLSALGRAQAEAAADVLAAGPPLDLVTSPLARARETAAAFARRCGATPRVEPAVAEIPSPGIAMAERRAWLLRLMAGAWGEAAPGLRDWRDAVVAALCALPRDTAVFSHFIAINVAVGAATDSDSVVCFRPANASLTWLETDGRTLRLLALGAEGETRVN